MFALLEAAMRPGHTGTTNAELKRAATLLSELVRTEDEDLSSFATRRLPGRSIDEQSLKEARAFAIDVARLVSLQGAPEAAELLSQLRSRLSEGLDALNRDAPREAPIPARQEPSIAPAAMPSAGPFPKPSFAVALSQRPPVGGSEEPFLPKFGTVTAVEFVPNRPTLPFAKGDGRPPPKTGATTEKLPADLHPKARLPETDDDELFISSNMTVMADPDSASKPSLPFAGAPKPAAAAPPSSPEEDDDLFISSNLTAPISSLGPRAAALPFPSTKADAAPASQPAPSALRLPPHLARITIDAHAALYALLQLYPEREPEIFARYGVRDRSERDALDRHWFARCHADPALGAQWTALRDQAIAHYRASR